MKKLAFFFALLLSFHLHAETDDEMIEKLVKEKEAQAKSYKQIDDGVTAVKDAPLKFLEELNKKGHQTLDTKALFDPQMVDTFQKLLSQSQLNQMSDAALKELILKQSKGKITEKIFKSYPKLLDKVVLILKDKEALPRLIEIIKRQEDLKNFFIISVVLFILSILLKKMFVPKDAGFFRRLVTSLSIKLIIGSGSLTLFYFMFEREVSRLVALLIA